MTTRFSEWRRASGFTLAECSGLSGYSVPHLSRVERGERALSAQGKVKLARSLGVAVSDLFEPDALRGRHQTEPRVVNHDQIRAGTPGGLEVNKSRLKEWREAKGYTLEDVEGLSGYSRAHLSQVERGKRGMSPIAKVRLARSLGVAVGDLFEPEAR